MKQSQKTERQLFAKIKNTLNSLGQLIRLENILIPGLPDCIFIYEGEASFIELKIARSNKITMPVFQFAMCRAMELSKNRHWYFVLEDDGINHEIVNVYRANQIKHAHTTTIENTITISLKGMEPVHCIRNNKDLEEWTAYL